MSDLNAADMAVPISLTRKPRLRSENNTIRAAENCATWVPGRPISLEVLTSCNPRYFKPLGLPPRVFGAHTGPTLDLQNLLNPAEEERTLGPLPRLSHRAAAH